MYWVEELAGGVPFSLDKDPNGHYKTWPKFQPGDRQPGKEGDPGDKELELCLVDKRFEFALAYHKIAATKGIEKERLKWEQLQEIMDQVGTHGGVLKILERRHGDSAGYCDATNYKVHTRGCEPNFTVPEHSKRVSFPAR